MMISFAAKRILIEISPLSQSQSVGLVQSSLPCLGGLGWLAGWLFLVISGIRCGRIGIVLGGIAMRFTSGLIAISTRAAFCQPSFQFRRFRGRFVDLLYKSIQKRTAPTAAGSSAKALADLARECHFLNADIVDDLAP